MENLEKPLFQDPKKDWQRLKETEYRKSVEAAELLYQMSLSGNDDKIKTKQLCETIGPYGPFQDHLVECEMGTFEKGQYGGDKYRISPHFFETLPILNKMAKIYENFDNQIYAKGSLFLNSDIRRLSNDARFVLYRGLSHINKETLFHLDKAKTEDFFESLKLILTSSQDHAIGKTINFINNYYDFFQKLSEDKQIPGIKNRTEELQNLLKTREFERIIIGAVQQGIKSQREIDRYKLKIELDGQLKEILAKYGFDPDEILNVWSGSYTKNGPEPQIENNMNKVFDLEDKRPGISRLLYKEFGIRNFERYPDSILIAQFDEFKDNKKPYGVLIQATHDWNGAFGAWSNIKIWEKMFEQIKDRYSFRIVEVNSKFELARRLIGLDRKYGEMHKLSFAFIGGHGSESAITFGGEHRNNMLLLEDLTGHGVQRTNKFFETNPTIVLDSCSTGAEGGIGQELSKVLGAKVIAPKIPASPKNIEAILSDKKIDFKIEYQAKDEQPDIAKSYSFGNEIKTSSKN